MKVVFQRRWEAFSTARRNISMGLCIFRTAGGVFEVYAYVCLCVFACTESRGCVFFGHVDVRTYELGFWESTQGGGGGYKPLFHSSLRPQQPGKLQSARGTALKKGKGIVASRGRTVPHWLLRVVRIWSTPIPTTSPHPSLPMCQAKLLLRLSTPK